MHMLAVLPERQGKGIAKKLVRYVTDIVRILKDAIDVSLIEMELVVIWLLQYSSQTSPFTNDLDFRSSELEKLKQTDSN